MLLNFTPEELEIIEKANQLLAQQYAHKKERDIRRSTIIFFSSLTLATSSIAYAGMFVHALYNLLCIPLVAIYTYLWIKYDAEPNNPYNCKVDFRQRRPYTIIGGIGVDWFEYQEQAENDMARAKAVYKFRKDYSTLHRGNSKW